MSDYPKFHWDLVQGTDEWHDVRKARITASVADTFLVPGKGESGFGVGAFTELYKIIEEVRTGEPRASFSSTATDFGHDNEDAAAESYEMEHFIKTKKIGFVERSEFTGCSPDRLIPELKKGLEIKCFPTKHVQIFHTKQHGKSEYIQCQFSMWVTGYTEWDLWYYHPSPNLPPVLFTFKPDLELFKKFEEREKAFIELVQSRLKDYDKYSI